MGSAAHTSTSFAARRSVGRRVSYALGITSPRRVVILGLVVCAVMLSVAVPLRNYLTQRSELAAVHEQQHMLEDKVAELERRRALQDDPQYVEAQARERLRYVRPGETPYVVQLPPEPAPPEEDEATGEDEATQILESWFTKLWKTIVGE